MKQTISALAMAAMLALPGVAGADTLRMGFASAPRTIDPYPFGGAPTASLKEHVFEALVASDDSPLLASGWEWTSPTTLDVTLRDGITFHNGEPLTARDVVYSACRMMHLIDGKRNLLTSSMGPIADVVAVDDHTVRFEMKAPYPLWVQKMKFLSILSASGAELPDGPIQYDSEGDCGVTAYPTIAEFESGEAAIGTGPYKLARFDKSGEADLVRNDSYWGEAPEWDEVEIRTIGNAGARLAGLLAGDFDLIENPTTEDLPGLTASDELTYTAVPSWRSIFLVLDVDPEGAGGVSAPDGSAPLADPRVRQAMSMAINRQAIADRLFGGEATVANQFSPKYRTGAPELPELEYNPEKAKELLAEAGYGDGFTIDFYAPSDRYANGARVAQAVTQYLSRIGITVNLKTQPWSVFAGQRSAGELGVFLYGWGHPQGPAQMISFAFASRDKDLGLGASNYSNYQSDAFDAAMQAWAVETDEAKANAHIADAMKVVVEDLPGIPLYYQHTIWAHRADLEVNGRPDERTSATTVSRK
ncbi:MAG: ABC transporter substrate-binding protein [Marinibacterium sp.]|nr:ABC transporter substrate-binding protein [Marinibacterium sp.]